jgi:RNA polymerase sigma-70 factor (ECF subfamily)
VDDRARFEQLYRTHADRVHAYAARRSSTAVADDIVSEVFIVAWRKLDQMPDDPLPWLLAVARRVLANHRRSDSRFDALRARLVGTEPASGADEAAGLDLASALRGLSEGDRELLMLIAWDGLELSEMAAMLGIRRGTVAVRVHRARRRLAAALAAQEPALKMEVGR